MADAPLQVKNGELKDLTRRNTVLLLTHDGKIDKKLNKAVNNIARNESDLIMVTLNYIEDSEAIETLDISDAAPTLLIYEEGDEIGRIFRAKAKQLYDYVEYLLGDGPQPDNRIHTEKANVASRTVSPTHVTERNFKSTVLKSKQPVLVDYWAAWCGPCNTLAPVVERLAVEFDGQARVAKVNVDENPGLSRQFGVQSLPTMIIYKNGKEVDRIIGAQPENVIRRRVEEWT